jgi:hypothetical protein
VSSICRTPVTFHVRHKVSQSLHRRFGLKIEIKRDLGKREAYRRIEIVPGFKPKPLALDIRPKHIRELFPCYGVNAPNAFAPGKVVVAHLDKGGAAEHRHVVRSERPDSLQT